MIENIPFRLKSPEMNFFGTRVILDIVAFLKLALNDHDYESLKRVCNKGILYLKKQQLEYAVNDCKFRKLSVFDALEKQMQYVKREYRDRAENFHDFIKSISSSSPINAIRSILENGYAKNAAKSSWRKSSRLGQIRYLHSDQRRCSVRSDRRTHLCTDL